jgi:hypothetical protein
MISQLGRIHGNVTGGVNTKILAPDDPTREGALIIGGEIERHDANHFSHNPAISKL